MEIQQIAYEVDRIEDLRQKAAELRAQDIEVIGPERKTAGMDVTIEFVILMATKSSFTVIWSRSAGMTVADLQSCGARKEIFELLTSDSQC